MHGRNRTYRTCRTHILEGEPEVAANILVCAGSPRLKTGAKGRAVKCLKKAGAKAGAWEEEDI